MAEEGAYFYEWEELGKEWLTSEDSFDKDYPSKPYDPGDSLAAWVIEDIFGLKLDPDSMNLGSYLPGYDVRDRDAYQMVQLSLSAELVNNKVIECYATKDGTVKFFEIGVNNSRIKNDVLYEINSGELKAKCDKVLVTGYDPPPKRYTKDAPCNLFTFIKDKAGFIPTADLDPDNNKYPRYHVYGDVLGLEACDNFREGYIEYGKLDFNMEHAILKEGDMYKIEKIPNYIYKITVPFYQAGNTDVNFSNTTPRYMELKNFGKLQRRNWKPKGWYTPTVCLPDTEIDKDVGVFLEESTSAKFLGVKAVYIWGYPIKNIVDGEKKGYVSSDANFKADVDSFLCEPYRLTEGGDYLIRRKDEQKNSGYKIIFSSNISKTYESCFGSSTAIFRIHASSIFREENEDLKLASADPSGKISGVLRDGTTPVDTDTMYYGVLFPIGEGQSAYVLPEATGLVKSGKIIVVYEWDNPSIQITDLRNEVTLENLRRVKVEFYPVIIKDENAPQIICNKGGITVLDPTEVIPDIDVDTIENLSEKEYVRATQLEQGDISVVMPFADEEGCKTIARFIYDKQNETANDVTYTCGPDAEPVLGEVINGNVINSIDYSYQDSSQYLISVKAGSIWQGMNSWNQSLYNMRTESVQEEGLVVGVGKDNIKCDVNLKHLGIMECVNISKEKIEKGDKVQVTVQNNPVSL